MRIRHLLARPAKPHEPTTERNLAKDLYGPFDIRKTADGSTAYIIPHTIEYSVVHWMEDTHVILTEAVASLWMFLLYGKEIVAPAYWYFVTQPERLSLASASAFPLVCIATALVMSALFVLTGYRVRTILTITTRGLILDNRFFYPASDIWNIEYFQQEENGTITWLIKIQLGVHHLILAHAFEEVPAKLFVRNFQNDMRRYWHRHNA